MPRSGDASPPVPFIRVRQALELTETNPAQSHALVDQALANAQSSMKYYAPRAPIWTVAAERAKKRSL